MTVRRGRSRAGIRCVRCDRLAPVRVHELEGGEHPYLPGVVDVPTIVIPPETPPPDSVPFEERVAWLADPDGDGLLCAPAEPGGPGCATPEEHADYLASVANVERVTSAIYEDETGVSSRRDDIDHLDLDHG